MSGTGPFSARTASSTRVGPVRAAPIAGAYAGAMRSQSLALSLESGGSLPLSRRIAGAIIQAIRDGRLKSGASLPGTRALASSLGVHRNTVIAAFLLLEQEGWIESRPGSGSFVREDLPGPARPRIVQSSVPAFPFVFPAESASEVLDGRINLRDLVPDGRIFPTQDWVRSYHHALQGSHRTGLGDKDPRGFLPLRRELAKLLAERRGISCTAQDIVLIPSPMRGLDLVARMLLRPGDAVAVEEPGHPETRAVLRNAGARLLPIPVDREGMEIDRLAGFSGEDRPRLVLVTPGLQYPTGVALSEGRREALLRWSFTAKTPVLEDDTWGLLDLSVPPRPALAGQDRTGSVLHVGSLGPALAPGLQVGYFVAHPEVVEHAARRWRKLNLGVDPFVAHALAEWLEEGLFHRQLRRARGLYKARLALATAWARDRAGGIPAAPQGGLGLWLRCPGLRPGFQARAAAQGILVQRPEPFWFGPPREGGLFLAIGAQDAESLPAILERLGELLDQDAE